MKPAKEKICSRRSVKNDKRERERERRTLILGSAKTGRSRSTDEREIRLRSSPGESTAQQLRRRSEVRDTRQEILVEVTTLHRVDEENTFETVVIHTFAQPTSTGKSIEQSPPLLRERSEELLPIDMSGELVSDQNMIDIPARHQSTVVVSNANARQLPEILMFHFHFQRALRRQSDDFGRAEEASQGEVRIGGGATGDASRRNDDHLIEQIDVRVGVGKAFVVEQLERFQMGEKLFSRVAVVRTQKGFAFVQRLKKIALREQLGEMPREKTTLQCQTNEGTGKADLRGRDRDGIVTETRADRVEVAHQRRLASRRD